MTISSLLEQSRAIWGNHRLTLSEVIVRLGVIYGDICRFERNAPKDATHHTDDELKKELGNVILSTIRWCDDLGYNPEECIEIAKACQKNFAQEIRKSAADEGDARRC